jgi:EAL domain-containing protein (putative c-di-GMP-specific phosphodiesterase class I)
MTPNTNEEVMALVHPSDVKELKADLLRIQLGKKKDHDMTYRWMKKDGDSVWVNCRGNVVEDENGQPFVLLGRVSRTILENKINKITGIFNRNKMSEDMKVKQKAGKEGMLLLLGLDWLSKKFSEYGREVVQSIVKYCGNELESMVSNKISVYHVEDYVFAVCMENANKADVSDFYNTLTAKMNESATITAVALPCGKLMMDEKTMYATAIKQLVEAKKYARSKLTILLEEDIEEVIDKKSLTDELIESVYGDFRGFSIRYQPQIEHGSFKLVGVEALMRYKSLSGKNYSPAEFLPLMEQAGLMGEASLWILKNAIAKVKEWREKIHNLRLNVNFSFLILEEKIEEIIKIFKESSLPSKTLVIELIETVSADEVDNVSSLTRACKEAGIGISIDDFGTGYSSLALLKEIHCDEIKIERTFVTGIRSDSYSYLLINSLIGFSHSHGISVCCEGVESEKDVLTVARLHPDLYQGFAFDKPCTEQEIEERYIKKSSKEYKERKALSRRLRKKIKETVSKFDPKEILTDIGVGLCVLGCDFSTNVFDMHPDKITQKILGMPEGLTPVDCNKFWFSRIKEGYIGYVKKRLDALKETEDSFNTFRRPWLNGLKWTHKHFVKAKRIRAVFANNIIGVDYIAERF